VVVDQGSDPVPRLGHRVTVFRPGRNLGACGRNLGVASCDTPYVAFSDDDSWWADGSLAAAADLFDAHPRLGLLAASVCVEPDGRPDPFNDLLAASPLPGGGPGRPILGFMACASVVRRTAFLEVGGFAANIGVGGEEERVALDLASAGWELRYVADLRAHHAPEPGGRDGRQRRAVRNGIWTAWQRLPVGLALRSTVGLMRSGDGHEALLGGIDALRGLPLALRERRPVTPAVVAQRRLLIGSPPRRTV
jgi:Glycosyl transferase family 2